MAIRKIITIPDPRLGQKCAKVKNIDAETKQLVKDLIDTLDVAKDPEGAGLAASQLGVLQRVCVVRNFYDDPANPGKVIAENFVLINPKIVSKSEETDVEWEGCLSVPNAYGRVKRFSKLKVDALDESGNSIRLKASDYFARVIQHEIDHLDGIVFTERVEGKLMSEKELDEMIEAKSK